MSPLVTAAPRAGTLGAGHLYRRCHTLRLTKAEVDACLTLPALQALGKQRYHQLCFRFHPDHMLQYSLNGRARQGRAGAMFQRIVAAYEWLMQLTPRQFQRQRQRQRVRTTEPDLEMPWAWTWARERRLPDGYHEAQHWGDWLI